jgi:hypothetical protein
MGVITTWALLCRMKENRQLFLQCLVLDCTCPQQAAKSFANGAFL